MEQLTFHIYNPQPTIQTTLRLSTPYFTLSTPHFTHHTLHFYTLHSTLYTSNSALYNLRFALHTSPHISTHLHTLQFTPNSTLCTLHTALYTLRFTLRPLHITLYTLHSTLSTVHSTLHTLHPLANVSAREPRTSLPFSPSGCKHTHCLTRHAGQSIGGRHQTRTSSP